MSERGPKNPFKVVTDVAREEGTRALWRGASTMIVVSRNINHHDHSVPLPDFTQPLNSTLLLIAHPPTHFSSLHSCSTSQGSFAKDAIRFATFDTIKSLFSTYPSSSPSATQSLLSGLSAGIVASTLVITPTERLKTALIDDAHRAHLTSTPRHFRGALHATANIWRSKGIRGLWAGYAATTLKQAGATTVRLGSYDIIKTWERSKGFEGGVALNFANGAVAGTVTTLLTQPVDTVKTRAQSVKGAGVVEAVSEIWRRDGVKGFWRGTVMRLGRTVISGGVLFTTNEAVMDLIRPVFEKVVESD